MPNTRWFRRRAGEGACGADHGAGRGGHAAGHDGALPGVLDLSAEGRGDGAGSCGGGRRGLAADADGGRASGARVITTVSTEEKAELSREAGASDVILYTEKEFEPEVKRLTGGKGVDVVYDSVGSTTFEGSLNCLRPRGLLALFGASSGPVPPFDLIQLSGKGSLFITRPTLWHYIATRAELEWRAGDVLGWAAKGELKLRTEHVYPLSEAAQAQSDLEARKTTGKILLEP